MLLQNVCVLKYVFTLLIPITLILGALLWFKPFNKVGVKTTDNINETPIPSPVTQDTKVTFPSLVKIQPYTDLYYLTQEQYDLSIKNIQKVDADRNARIGKNLVYPDDGRWLYFSFFNGNASQNTEEFVTKTAVCQMQMLWCGSLDLTNKESVEDILNSCKERYTGANVLENNESNSDDCCIKLMKKVAYQFSCIGNPFSRQQNYKNNSQLTRQVLFNHKIDYANTISSKNGLMYVLLEGGHLDLEELDFGSLPSTFFIAKNNNSKTGEIERIDIRLKTESDPELSPTVVTIWNASNSDFRPDPYPPQKVRSRLGTITFLGNEYQIHVDENSTHGDGPALNPGDCSYSLTGNRHYFNIAEGLEFEINEQVSSSFCNGTKTTTVTPNKTELDNLIKVIQNIKLRSVLPD